MATKKGKYRYVLYSLLVISFWGLVPAFAKLGSLSTGLTTMYVNWFAVAGILVIMLFNKTIHEINRQQPYKKIIGVGLLWPLAYSITYFGAIDLGSSSMTTITNYTWPVFYLLLAGIIAKRRFPRTSWLVVSLAVVAVAIPIALEGEMHLAMVPIALGLAAAFFQAIYSFVTEKWKEEPWLITFVVEVVTAIGATVYVLFFEKMVFPSLTTLFYLAFIGVLANGVGFWAFLKAGQESAKAGENSKTLFLVLMCTTPLIQVVVLPFLGVEIVSSTRWIGVIIIAFALLIYSLFLSRATENKAVG